MSWTDERVAQLKELWQTGLSASQIAKKIGGVSRNAVIGKVHRLGLSGRAKTSPMTPPPREAQEILEANGLNDVQPPARGTNRGSGGRTRAAPLGEPQPILTNEQRASVLHLNEHTCKWPLGDPGTTEFKFCGARAKVGSPYCETHAAMAYQPLEKRKKLGL